MERQNLQTVSDDLCDSALKPAANQTCANIPCAARWSEGSWGECSEPCGEDGTQTIQVYCYKIVTHG